MLLKHAWLSEDSKKLLKERDAAQAKAALTKDPDDWRLYKNLRNTATAKKKQRRKLGEKGSLIVLNTTLVLFGKMYRAG